MPVTVLNVLHMLPNSSFNSSVRCVLEGKQSTEATAVSRALQHHSRTCLSPLQSRVGGAAPRELITRGTGLRLGWPWAPWRQPWHHIALWGGEGGLAGENNHICWTPPMAGIGWSPLRSIALLKGQDPSGVNNYYLHVTDEKNETWKIKSLPQNLTIKTWFLLQSQS